MLLENTCKGVHLIVKLPAISLQASKFTKNEPLHTCFKDFSQILIGIYCAFSRNHFMEGCFMFQQGGLFFRWQGLHFEGGRRCPMGGHCGFWWGGGGGSKKIVRWGRGFPHAPSTMGNPASSLYKWQVDLNRPLKTHYRQLFSTITIVAKYYDDKYSHFSYFTLYCLHDLKLNSPNIV